MPDSFFPLRDAPTKTTKAASKPTTQYDEPQGNTRVLPADQTCRKWTSHLQGPRARTQLRAWSRVQLPSQSTRNFSGTVMKRVGLPIPRPAKPSATTRPATSAPAPKEPAMAEDGMPVRRVLRRLESYEASDEECPVKGKPLSKLEMAGLQMQAKADVAHCLKTCPTAITREEARQRRRGHYVQTVPLKRRTGTLTNAGNRLNTYADALELPTVKPTFRVPSRRFSVLPRQPASPTRSPVALFSPAQEPVTPAAVMEPPRDTSDAKSPTKRSPRHKSPPIKHETPRISDPAIRLLPSLTPKIEPSPTKSASPPPATPLSETRALGPGAVTPSTFPKAAPFGTAFADMQRHSALRPGASPLRLSPRTLAATPCPTLLKFKLTVQTSPVKQRSPKEAVLPAPGTPRIFTNLPLATEEVPSPIAFVANLFPDSPAKQAVELQSGTPKKPTSFDFGTTSPGFNSVTWLKDAEPAAQHPVAALKKGSRRQSEPLVRNFMKANTRRQTVSPTKLVFQAAQSCTGSDGLFSPVKKDAAQPKLEASELKLAAAPIMPKPVKSRQSLDSRVSPTPKQATSEVVNIDMRQNPDIFGTKAMSLSLSPVMGAALPSIAESCTEAEGSEETAKKIFSPSADVKTQVTKSSEKQVGSPDAEELLSPALDNSLGIFETVDCADIPVISLESPHESDADKGSPEIIQRSPAAVTRPVDASKGQKKSPSPTLNLSFTPVNARSPTTAEVTALVDELIPESPPVATTKVIETVSAQSHDYDSPGRDYMREFIRRSRPKRPSTTESGSPVGPTVKRQPLGPKSPNTSPSKSKRKAEKEHDGSPPKKLSISPKKMNQHGKSAAKRAATNENEETQTLDIKTASESAIAADDEEDDAEMDGANSRRSSRLRGQTRVPSVKSAIPTPIKIGRNSGPALNSAVRSEQQDLTNQTRMNTRKNKGNAEYPAQFLARQSEEAQTETEPEQREPSSEKEGRKCVNWSNPLAMYQEDNSHENEKDKPKKPKPTTTKPKSVQMSGIAKPVTRAKTTADKERTARLAEHFGMVSNGTPAKPQRSMRSRMRI